MSPSGLSCAGFLYALLVIDTAHFEALLSTRSFGRFGSALLILGSSSVGFSLLVHAFLECLVPVAGLSWVGFAFALPVIDSFKIDSSLLPQSFAHIDLMLLVGDFAALEFSLFPRGFAYMGSPSSLGNLVRSGVLLSSMSPACLGMSLILRQAFCSNMMLPVLDFAGMDFLVLFRSPTCSGIALPANSCLDMLSLLHGCGCLGFLLSSLECTQLGFPSAAHGFSCSEARLSAPDLLTLGFFLFAQSFVCLGTSLSVKAATSNGKIVRSTDGNVRVEVTDAGGQFIGDWSMPSNLANSISSFVRVGPLPVYDFSSPDIFASIRRFSHTDSLLSVSKIV